MEESITENKNLSENKNEENKTEKKLSDLDKLLGYNKLASLLLSADRFEQSIQIYLKGVELYEKLSENKPINIFFFANLYSNLAKAYSCLRQFESAEKHYRKCIDFHPVYKLIQKEKEIFNQSFKIDVEKDLLFNFDKIIDEDINSKNEILLKFFNDKSNKFH
jgi:tetratricopeptide (TPR) repeat protein